MIDHALIWFDLKSQSLQVLWWLFTAITAIEEPYQSLRPWQMNMGISWLIFLHTCMLFPTWKSHVQLKFFDYPGTHSADQLILTGTQDWYCPRLGMASEPMQPGEWGSCIWHQNPYGHVPVKAAVTNRLHGRFMVNKQIGIWQHGS